MEIAGEYGNIPSRVADWPHRYDFLGDTCDDLMVCDASRSLKLQGNGRFLCIVWQTTLCDFKLLEASQTRKKWQQCGQSATYDGIFELSPAMFIAAMAIRNI